MAGIWQFYDNLNATEPTDALSECMQLIPNIVTNDMNEHLIAPVTMAEVEKAVFSLGALKAPGPDGFNGQFYQKNWHNIKNDIFQVVSVFLDTSHLKEDVNATVVALVPKIPMPKSISHLRPISCCNYLYKIIAKILVSRLKPFMNHLVGGGLIQDDLIIAHGAFHFLKKNTSRGGEG